MSLIVILAGKINDDIKKKLAKNETKEVLTCGCIKYYQNGKLISTTLGKDCYQEFT